MINDVGYLIDKLMDFFGVSSNYQLAEKLGMQPSSISSWKNKNSVTAIKKKCRELGIYSEIFRDSNTQINDFKNSNNVVAQDFSKDSHSSHTQTSSYNNIDPNILKLVDTLYSFAKENQKIDELKSDLSSLFPKYMS